MGKKGKRGGKPAAKKAIFKRLDALVKKLEEELKGADLFAPLPPAEDCPICFIPLPHGDSSATMLIYHACCGKYVCEGCYKENKSLIEKQNAKDAGKKDKKPIMEVCPFCREPAPDARDYLRQLEKRAAQNDFHAHAMLGVIYSDEPEDYVAAKDELKGFGHFVRAAELELPAAYWNIGVSYDSGDFAPVNKKKAALFFKVGAVRGSICSRHEIGEIEYQSGNHEIGIRHWKIAAEAGHQPALNKIKKIYNADGNLPGKAFISKEYMDKAYRVCHEAQEEIKSEEREKYR